MGLLQLPVGVGVFARSYGSVSFDEADRQPLWKSSSAASRSGQAMRRRPLSAKSSRRPGGPELGPNVPPTGGCGARRLTGDLSRSRGILQGGVSKENVELARRSWELWSEGADEEVARQLGSRRGVAPPGRPRYSDGGHLPGAGGGTRAVDSDSRLVRCGPSEIEEVRDLSSTEVLVLGSLHLEGRGSGAAVTTPFGAVTEILDGLAVRQRFWTDQSKALEPRRALGVARPPSSFWLFLHNS